MGPVIVSPTGDSQTFLRNEIRVLATLRRGPSIRRWQIAADTGFELDFE